MVVMDDFIVDFTVTGHSGCVNDYDRHFGDSRTLPIIMISLAQRVDEYANFADFGDRASITIMDADTGKLIAMYEYNYDGNCDYGARFLRSLGNGGLRDVDYRVRRFIDGRVGWSMCGGGDDVAHSYCMLIDLIALSTSPRGINSVSYEFTDDRGEYQHIFIN